MCLQQTGALHGDGDYSLTLSTRRLHDIAIFIIKAVNRVLPGYISDLLVVRNNMKYLRHQQAPP